MRFQHNKNANSFYFVNIHLLQMVANLFKETEVYDTIRKQKTVQGINLSTCTVKRTWRGHNRTPDTFPNLFG